MWQYDFLSFDPFPFIDWLVLRLTLLGLLAIGAYIVLKEAWNYATKKSIGRGRHRADSSNQKVNINGSEILIFLVPHTQEEFHGCWRETLVVIIGKRK